jgi:blue light- and temperature-responsive anti-repressor
VLIGSTMLRVIYISRNLLPEPAADAELERILLRARACNAALGVTGALLFSGDCFAQALEGPAPAVEAVFESIQRDPRHSEVVVLEAAPVPAREFGAWSMAYAGRCHDAEARFAALAGSAGSGEGAPAGRVLELLRRVVGHAGTPERAPAVPA